MEQIRPDQPPEYTVDKALRALQRLHQEFVRMSIATVLLMAVFIVSVVSEKQGAAFRIGPRLTMLCFMLALVGMVCTAFVSTFMYRPLKRLRQGEEGEDGATRAD